MFKYIRYSYTYEKNSGTNNQFSCFFPPSDIALEPDKAVKKVEENLKLGLTDEEAVQHLHYLLDLSITAVMPALVEQIHKLTQYWRK